MSETRVMYMHTMDDQPASFDAQLGDYIYFARGRDKARLVSPLKQIRREQRAAKRGDAEMGRTGDFKYGYVLVEVPRA